MGVETERKYLVKNKGYLSLAKEKHTIKQGYLQREPERTVRIRTKDERGYITVKGLTKGCSRLEFEYEIPYEDALQMLALCAGRIIEKTRYIVGHDGMCWEIDEFEGDLSPLVVAEIELPDADCTYTLPDFIGEEVTGNPKYYNSNL